MSLADDLKKMRAAQQKEADFEAYIKVVQPKIVKEFKKKLDAIPTKKGKNLAGKTIDVVADNEELDQFILELPDTLEEVFDKTGYRREAYKFLTNFDLLEEANISLQETVNDVKIQRKTLGRVRAAMVDFTINQMVGNGLKASLILPVADSLKLAAIGNASYLETVDKLGDILGGTDETVGAFSRLATLATRDSFYQYNGLINSEIAKQFDYNAYQYIGSLVEESRPQCDRWVEMEYISFDELESEIQWAFDNGSGMIVGTVPDNFAMFRGGYNCRHICIPVFREPENTDQNGNN
jgi:hypothetical protein